MNYIKKLQAENENLKARVENTQQAIRELRMELRGSKYTGWDSDGDRKDWMSTADIEIRLDVLVDTLCDTEA